MIIVNLYGAPCSSKSTFAAFLFQFFKNRGFDCELVSEYAKQLVYQKRENDLSNQFYVSAKQYQKLKSIEQYGNVPFVITDSPLLLGLAYSKHLPYYEELKTLLFKLNSEFQNINVFLERNHPYNPVGRLQTEEESQKLSFDIGELMTEDRSSALIYYFYKSGQQDQIRLANNLLDYFLENSKK